VAEQPAFPFVGAGDANYFEWAEMFVCFARAPKGPEAAAIAKRVPEPLRDTITWTGPLLWVASGQGVGRLIKAAYKKPPAAPSKLTTTSRFAIAPATAYTRFRKEDALLARASAALGRPTPRYTKTRDDLATALPALAKLLPATAKRLARIKGPTVRRGASAAGKTLDMALDLAIKACKVWNNLA
jgi:hypothetical protein